MSEEPKLQEVVLVDEKKAVDAPKENPLFVSDAEWTKFSQGVTLPTVAGALGGAFAAGIIPRFVKWDTGIKGVVASVAATLAGGYVLGKVAGQKNIAFGFVIGGSVVCAIKVLRMFLGDRPEMKVLGQGVGVDDLIYGDYGADYDEFFGEDKDVFSEEELFGIGEDPIIPTAGDY